MNTFFKQAGNFLRLRYKKSSDTNFPGGENSAFTLIEILVVMGIIAVLAGIVLIAINPSRQFAQARNTQRQSNVHEILNAIGQRIADNHGSFRLANDKVCTTDIATTTAMRMASTTPVVANSFDITACVVPTYLASIPLDPDSNYGYFTSESNYNTGYTIQRNATTSRITVSAPYSELGETISITR
jgi:prepilin-type N-terminal cleavage/methylation domain-containing protein